MKLSPTLEEMLADLKGRIASPERKEVVAALTVDLAQLSTRALAGENVAGELQHVKAQGELLAASEVELVRNTLTDWIAIVTGAVIRGALAAI